MYGILLVKSGPDQGETLQVLPGKTLLLGRGTESPGNLTDPYVSRLHCKVAFENGKVLLTDESKSPSGTVVNGERITQHELKAGDVILIGRTQLSFQWTDGDERPTVPWQPKDE